VVFVWARLVGLVFSLITPVLVATLVVATRQDAPLEMAFVTRRDRGNSEIYRMDIARRLTVNLTKTAYHRRTRYPSYDQAPAWSPDGTMIAFQSNRTGNDEIWVMDADGRHPRRLTSHRQMDMHPAWSPDGRYIVYQSWREDDFEIYRLDLTAPDAPPVRLTDNPHGDRHPVYTPDGATILYASTQDNDLGNFGLFRMDADGTNARPMLTLNEEFNALHPDVSSDGGYVLFDGFTDNDESNVFMFRYSGRGSVQRVGGDPNANPATDAYLPSFTPDGSAVVYVSSRADGDSDVYLLPIVDELTLGEPQRLTTHPSLDVQPVVRPR
jgi:Tol biopolymer transport system component